MHIQIPEKITLEGSVRPSADAAAVPYHWTVSFADATPDDLVSILVNASSLRVKLQNQFRAGAIDAIAELSLSDIMESRPRTSLGQELAKARENMTREDYVKFLESKGIL